MLNGRRSEIWALGLRNPWRFSFDRSTGDLYIGDVGQNAFEELNFQSAGSPGGENYGWRIMEGFHCSATTSCPGIPCATAGLTPPVFEYAHGQGECSVTGGMVYRGLSYPPALGTYFYGDFCSGKIWGLRQTGTAWGNELLADAAFNITSFGEDETGELYVTNYGVGSIHRMDFFSFSDVPPGAFAFQEIEKIFFAGITEGCGGATSVPMRRSPERRWRSSSRRPSALPCLLPVPVPPSPT